MNRAMKLQECRHAEMVSSSFPGWAICPKCGFEGLWSTAARHIQERCRHEDPEKVYFQGASWDSCHTCNSFRMISPPRAVVIALMPDEAEGWYRWRPFGLPPRMRASLNSSEED